MAAKVEIDMGIEDWGKLAEEFLQKGDPTLVIATQLVPETGTGTSPTLIDQIVKPAGGAKTDENHMTWSNISWDTIAPYALGKQKITYMDSGITITVQKNGSTQQVRSLIQTIPKLAQTV